MPGAVDKKGQPKGPPKLTAEEEQAKLQEDPVNERGHYRNGLHLWALYAGDETWRECEVLESMRPASAAEGTGIEVVRYYVHYVDFNRRMDQWTMHGKLGMANPEDEAASLTWKAAPVDAATIGTAVRTTPKKRKASSSRVVEFVEEEYGDDTLMDEASIREHEQVTKIKNVNRIELGRYVIETWYFSPIPRELYPDGAVDTLYMSEFTLELYRHKSELLRHYSRCKRRHPPGDEIYRDEESRLAVFEVDGSKSKIYAQNLCYLAKFFLDHKALHFDVDPFLFYVVCEFDERGYHLVGYFSKEKYSDSGYNLACILTLPSYQRKGYGKFLISFSYELSKKEEKVGSPEKPLSDLGQISYRSYWSRALLTALRDVGVDRGSISIMDLTKVTSIKTEDVVATLTHLGLLCYTGGRHVVSLSPTLLKHHLDKLRPERARVKPEKLHWAPLKVDIKRDKWAIRSKRKVDKDGDGDEG